MESPYKCSLKIRGSTSEFETDNLAEFFCLLGEGVHRMERLALKAKPQDIEAGARELVRDYYERFVNENNMPLSPICRNGLEVEMAACFLRGMTTEKTVDWFLKEKGFKTSRTAVGRFFVRFRQLRSRKNPV